MNTTITKLQIPKFSLGMLALLVLLAPYAMSLGPFDRTYTDGVYQVTHSADPLYPQRLTLVLLGLITAVVGFAEFVGSLRRIRTDVVILASFAAAFLACAVVGWRSYPYWVTGVYQVGIGAFPPVDQDPKALMPMVWIGDFWRVPVLLIYLLSFVAVPVLTIIGLYGLWRRRVAATAITLACTAVTVVFMVGFSPDYIIWLMD